MDTRNYVRLKGPAAAGAFALKVGIPVSTIPPIVDVPPEEVERCKTEGRKYTDSAVEEKGRINRMKQVQLEGWFLSIEKASGAIPTIDEADQYLHIMNAGKTGAARGSLDKDTIAKIRRKVWPTIVEGKGGVRPTRAPVMKVTKLPTPKVANHAGIERDVAQLRAEVKESSALLRRVLQALGYTEPEAA